MERGTGWS